MTYQEKITQLLSQFVLSIDGVAMPTYRQHAKPVESALMRFTKKQLKEYSDQLGYFCGNPRASEYGTGKKAFCRRLLHYAPVLFSE